MVIAPYTLVLVNLDPTKGSEIQKTRPCVVLSPIEMNAHINTIIVAPMTSAQKAYPTRVAVQFQGKKGQIALDQIRTIDKSRILKVYERLGEATIQQCKQVLKELFVD